MANLHGRNGSAKSASSPPTCPERRTGNMRGISPFHRNRLADGTLMSPAKPRRCWAEIDPHALRHNLAAVRAALAPGVQVMAVVKANAYGHGVSHVVAALRGEAEMFGVAN